ncbi:MAG: HAD family phosphatase [Erysipelotrichaceae bacterium]|nr:HAD family phosphatase [Erysipelotrichaceae bacterium]
MDKDIRLVLCDIDGTLLTTGNPMKERTRHAINKLKELGIWFGLASGRTVDEMHKTIRQWGFDESFECLVGVNGAQLYDGIHKETFTYFEMEPQWIKEVLEMMRPYDLNPYIYDADRSIYLKEDDISRRARERGMRNVVVANGDESMLYAEKAPKVLYRMPEELVPEVLEMAFKKCPLDIYKPIRTQATMVEFGPSGADKAYAMDKFLERNNLTRDNVMSFGDTSNDNGMLLASGVSVCLCNGSDDTKACAQYITEVSCDDEGVADFLEKWFSFTCEG